MFTKFIRCLAVIAASLAFCAPGAAAPRRIVSVNLCADQYLLALADRNQIAALSQNARDPSLSFFHDRAEAYPMVAGTAEAILPLKPDLVLGSPARRLETRALLRRFGIPVLDLGLPRNFADVVAQTRLVAAAIGHRARGERLIARMRARLAAIARHRPAGPVRLAVHYQRQGYVSGTGTLMDDIMRRAGLQNLAGRLGDKQLAHVDLEAIVAARPDYILFTTGPGRGRDWGSLLLGHPALARSFAGRELSLPESLTVCGGPSYPDAVAALVAQIRAHPLPPPGAGPRRQ